MVQYWKDLSVSRKLYAVVGIMALLIATELFTLLFAMDILSAVRSFVGGEGLWSKAQKNAIHSLQRYGTTADERYWAQFKKDLRIPEGDRLARTAMTGDHFDFAEARRGFIQGGNDPEDVNGLIRLIRRFAWVSYIGRALTVWHDADLILEKVMVAADQLREAIHLRDAIHRSPRDFRAVDRALRLVDGYNVQLTALENDFSTVLGQGSRWLEGVLMTLLMLAVFTVESTGLLLTISFSQSLSRNLRALTEGARQVGSGNFNVRMPVESRDELGQLAGALNKMTEDLRQHVGARHHAESANQVKSIFLANMSHEIRTPLGVIMGLAEILKEPGLNRRDHLQYVETIERTGQNLNRIINDILDLSRVEAGHLEIEESRFSLSDFLNELYSMLNVRAAKTQNELVFAPLGQPPDFIVTDRNRLRQILVNVVNNALKFTNQGSVTVAYSYAERDLKFLVTDSGQGMSPAQKIALFEPFARGDRVGDKEGTGLGLVLSQRLARALGGDVTLLKSEIGQGTTFEIHVRCRALADFERNDQPAESDGQSPVDKGLSGRHILVVEDSEDNQMLVRLLLSRKGVNVDFAANGQEGVDQAMGHVYDAVLMDMQMPVMDGYHATQMLRDRGYNRPILALTAHAMKEDRERCLAAGCDDYLTKPIDPAVLYGALARHLGHI